MIEAIFQIDKEKCTERVIESMTATLDSFKQHYSEFVTPEHLLYSISWQSEFLAYCLQSGVDQAELHGELANFLQRLDSIPTEDQELIVLPSIQLGELTDHVKQTWEEMNQNESRSYVNPITVADIIDGIYRLDDSFAHYILEKNFGDDAVATAEGIELMYAEDINKYIQSHPKPEQVNSKVITQAYINGEKIDINKLSPDELYGKLMASAGRLMGALGSLGQGFGHEKTAKKQKREPWEDLVTSISDTYKQKNPLIGREAELKRCIRVLCRKDKNNPLFVGEPGVGKTSLIYGLARLIDNGDVPKWLKDKQIYALNMASIVAGASFHGEFEKRMTSVLEGAKNRGNCIIYIDEIHTIMSSGGGNNTTNAADMLKPYLEDGSIRFIGCTTYQEYNKKIASNKAVARRFQQIDVKEPSVEETIEIIDGLLPNYEEHHGVRYDAEAVQYAVRQSDALIHDRFLPDKAIDIIDEAGAYLQQNPLLGKNGTPKATRYQKVSVDIIKHILTDVCRIDAKALTSQDNSELKNLDKRIRNDIYGQDDAVKQIVRSVMMSKAGLLEPDKPIASFLFVGPTGVGKTEVCKVLAQQLGIELVRFDMSEYTEKHAVSKLIGSPAGYVGYEEGGQLTDAIRKTPNCVLLLDEIEKAHADIYNILLQVMDYARLTDNKGNKADFRNVILVMTSNAGAQYAGQAAVGFGGGQTKGQAMLATVKKTFKPEFLNRLSGTVVFNEMDEHMASLILDKKLQQLSSRLASKNVAMKLTSKAHKFLLDRGFNTLYGAREMDRVIQQHLTPLLMNEILFGKLKKGGNATIELDGEDLKCIV